MVVQRAAGEFIDIFELIPLSMNDWVRCENSIEVGGGPDGRRPASSAWASGVAGPPPPSGMAERSTSKLLWITMKAAARDSANKRSHTEIADIKIVAPLCCNLQQQGKSYPAI